MANPTAAQKLNLLKLAAYLESLPRSYRHFDMWSFTEHRGECELPMPRNVYAAKEPGAFLANCGTVACAVGHGPAAGIRPLATEFLSQTSFNWRSYARRTLTRDEDGFDFMFGSGWKACDNHHYGAAARIRLFVDCGTPAGFDTPEREPLSQYASYRKGSRSAKRREIEAVVA